MLAGAPAASALTGAAIRVTLQPERLASSTSLTFAMSFSGGLGETPAPVHTVVVHLPAGLGIDVRNAATCPLARLRGGGASACPQASLLGRGHAQLQVLAGSQTIPEQAVIWAFRGPDRAGLPTVEILGVGSTPLNERTISIGVLRRDSAPFGSELVVSVAPIPTVVYEPNGSIDSVSITFGGAGHGRQARPAVRITVPRSCPQGGFPFAADVAFADGTSARAAVAVRCP